MEKLAFNVLGDATATCGDASSTSHASATSAVNDAPGESPLEAVHEVDEEAEAEDAVAPSPPGFSRPQPAKRAGYVHFACRVRWTSLVC